MTDAEFAVVIGFASLHSAKLRKNAEVTVEQVCRVLNECTAAWLRRRCSAQRARTRATVRYHQARNAAARKSRMRPRRGRLKELLAL